MTFTPNRIAAGPTYTRQRIKTVIGLITPAIPPNLRTVVAEDGTVEWQVQKARQEGQMLFYRNSANINPADSFVTMYVIVTIGGELVWKRVSNPLVFGNTFTGRNYDQNAGFYSPLAP
jgi:hypothetical protein